MFLTKPFKICSFFKRQNKQRNNENWTSVMFNGNNISARGFVLILGFI